MSVVTSAIAFGGVGAAVALIGAGIVRLLDTGSDAEAEAVKR